MKPTHIAPYLFATAPVFALMAHNAGQVRFSQTVVPILFLVAATAVLQAVATRVLRSSSKAAILLSLGFLIFFSYSHVSSTLTLQNRHLIPIALLIMALTTLWMYRSRADLSRAATLVLVIGIAQFIVPAGNIVSYVANHRGGSARTNYLDHFEPLAGHVAGGYRPDIYYIILDRYTDAGTLLRNFQFDNSPFVGTLEDLGFYVAADSRANYLVTSHSLASSLNLDHILFLTDEMGRESTNWFPLYSMLSDYRLWRFLEGQGYEFHHAGPKWNPTSRNPHADVNYQYERLPEFSALLCETTILDPLLKRLEILDRDREKWRRVNYQFEALGGLSYDAERPKFVFAHFLVPHNPYVFDADGSYLSPARVRARSEATNYLGQVQYVNDKALHLVRGLLARYPEDQPPVIVIQGDEGPYPERAKTLTFDWTGATAEEISQKMRILNAIYAPLAVDSLYENMTPVNTFRIILNAYFATGLPRLPDRSYSYRDLDHLYDLIETTDQINSVPR